MTGIFSLGSHILNRSVRVLMTLKNRRIDRHVVVFESDDWGSVRVTSNESLERLMQKQVRFFKTGLLYDRVDTLASNDDLELLMDALSGVCDVNGNPAKLTMNCVTANPDFEKIRESGFSRYFYEPISETFKRYPHHDRAFSLWKEGIAGKLFKPQFHGREHLNVQKWMGLLQSGRKNVLDAFDEGVYSMVVDTDTNMGSVMDAFNLDRQEEAAFISESIEEGLDLFENLFGYRSRTMIAPCFTWDDFVEDTAYRCGVTGIQGSYFQTHSNLERSGGRRITGHYMGETNANGQVYTVRNCSFEPSQDPSRNSDKCMAEISGAFKQGLPAVVSCHRLNFIGEKYVSNRDDNLGDFKKLLQMIVSQYPDVEFMSSDELSDYYRHENNQ